MAILFSMFSAMVEIYDMHIWRTCKFHKREQLDKALVSVSEKIFGSCRLILFVDRETAMLSRKNAWLQRHFFNRLKLNQINPHQEKNNPARKNAWLRGNGRSGSSSVSE